MLIFVSVRHHDDAVNWFDVSNTIFGIDKAASESDIVNNSWGTEDYSTGIAQIIQYWDNLGRLFIGAAGYVPWPCSYMDNSVRFPASLPEVAAVTATGQGGALLCSASRGPEVEFAAFVEQPTTGNKSVDPVEPDIARSSETSNASAVISGIAALVWSQNPSWSNEQVRQRLCDAAEGHGTDLNSAVGCGIVNAFGAVGGLWDITVDGPAFVEPVGPTAYDFTATPHGGAGPFLYNWSASHASVQLANTTSQTVTATVDESLDFFWLYITIQDVSDNTMVTISEFTEVVGCDQEQDPQCEA